MSTVKCTNIEALAGGGAPDNLLPITCSAWVNFNGTGTVAIRDSYNVSSITDGGVGIYTANFATNLANANYSLSGIVRRGSVNIDNNLFMPLAGTYSVSGVQVNAAASSSAAILVDCDIVCIHIFGGQ